MKFPQAMEVHVVRGLGGWVIHAVGPSFGREINPKATAVRIARGLARKYSAELVVHNRNGTISRKDSHGYDSPRRKG